MRVAGDEDAGLLTGVRSASLNFRTTLFPTVLKNDPSPLPKRLPDL